MILHYKYCGWIKDSNNKTKVWGIVVWVADDRTRDYMFWGTPTQLKIKSPQVYSKERKTWVSERIKRKRRQGYTKVEDKDINETFSELESEINMFMMLRKLKNA